MEKTEIILTQLVNCVKINARLVPKDVEQLALKKKKS